MRLGLPEGFLPFPTHTHPVSGVREAPVTVSDPYRTNSRQIFTFLLSVSTLPYGIRSLDVEYVLNLLEGDLKARWYQHPTGGRDVKVFVFRTTTSPEVVAQKVKLLDRGYAYSLLQIEVLEVSGNTEMVNYIKAEAL